MKEIDKLSNDELNGKVNSIKKDLFNMRFKKINGQLEDTSKISIIKKDLAKVLTKLNRKKK
jgi:large subunit ribosomal protein L29